MTQIDNRKKIPYARPVPRSFAAAWESNKEGAPRRSPSPRRFDEPPRWHRDDIRHHRPSEMDKPPPDNIHVLNDNPNMPPRPPVDRMTPFEPPPLPPPPTDVVVYPDGPAVEMREGPFKGGPDMPNNDHNFAPGGRPPEFMGSGGPMLPHPHSDGQNWGPLASNEDVSEHELMRQAEELYGADYAELLAMDNLDEALLANYEREASVPNELEMRPPRRGGRGGPMRGRGGPPRGGRGRSKPKSLMSIGFDERSRGGPGRRMRRGNRRGMYD